MKKSSSQIGEVEQKRKKRRRKVIIRSVLLVAFLLAVNTFAWFTYISKAGITLSGSVVNWDVLFLEETNVIKEMNIDITDMKPGMVPYEKEIKVNNNGDVNAKLSYKIESLTLLGQDILQGNQTTALESLTKDYPFKTKIDMTTTTIPVRGSGSIKIGLNWEYEKEEYYKINQLYTYDAGVYYYTQVGNTYQIDNTVTQANFQSKVATGLYLEKDDADSYWGYACGQYETNTNQPCLHMRVVLIVTQLD